MSTFLFFYPVKIVNIFLLARERELKPLKQSKLPRFLAHRIESNLEPIRAFLCLHLGVCSDHFYYIIKFSQGRFVFSHFSAFQIASWPFTMPNLQFQCVHVQRERHGFFPVISSKYDFLRLKYRYKWKLTDFDTLHSKNAELIAQKPTLFKIIPQ